MELPLRVLVLADVVLPLPLAETYTYRLPERLAGRVAVGSRIIVPFGSKKIYSAVVVRVYQATDVPDSHPARLSPYTLKEAVDLLDEAPVLLPDQLWLWRWIADYYLCTLGEVYKASMPGGMKLESESVVEFNPDYDAESPLGRAEQYLLDLMEHLRRQKVSELQKALADGTLQPEGGKGAKGRSPNVLSVIKSLLDKGALVMHEELQRNYRPKTVNCVRLSEAYFDEARLNQLSDELRRAEKQRNLLQRYLELSKARAALTLKNRTLLVEIEKPLLMEGHSEAALKGLKDRGVLEVYEKEVSRLQVASAQGMGLSAQGSATQPDAALHSLHATLSPAQQRAYGEIRSALDERDICLLHGVTGSGKTEIYTCLIQDALARGQQVLYLLPEIVLTAQLVERLRRVFGSRLGVYHSKYPDAERVEVWQKQLSTEPYDIIVGVRSSVFLPFQRLGLVIVDEEHETSFKQQEPAPRYHARNVALVLARHCHAKTLLGTATPSLESYYNAQNGRYGLVTLAERYGEARLPRIEVVDIRQQRHRKEMTGPFSQPLLQAMREALERREQVILFQNRRGYAPQIDCHVCGWTPRCTQCDVTLTLHRNAQRMTCHYCGATYPLPARCPNCESQELHIVGYGTERIEDEIQRLFPQARVARMDLDTTRSRQAYERIISDFQHGRTDILVGTQMVTKGLDFERVSLVGILNADTMLNMPDFRSYERSFQMLSQVAGRAGRRRRQGVVILQTKNPTLPVVGQVVANDYAALYRDQAEERSLFRYPPFSRLVYVYLKHRDVRVVEQLAHDAAALLRRSFGERVLGPDTPPVSRVQLLYIRKLVLKVEVAASMAQARSLLRQTQHYLLSQPQYKSAQVYYDVDPY
ncbi:MAG: primosomal protein N' [Bacteroidaceae bacterium]|nr:primosomal protein N' [Bacteroidaceae bacterium]